MIKTEKTEEARRIMAENLQRILNEKGLKQKTLAKAMGVSSATVCQWANAARYPRSLVLVRLAKYLDVDLLDLTTDYEKRKKYISEEKLITKTIMKNDGLKDLIFFAKDLSPESLKLISDMAKRLQTTPDGMVK